ncbi:uncharacterized protein TNCV_4572531 [Trichonephila clavipes]|nr:uncharacterized protein TNCV_4572531 [Trichonephila clavipes]
MKVTLYKGILARNPRCIRRRRIDEADISTPVAVDQRAANCLDEAVRPFTTMRSRCRSSNADVAFHRPLPAEFYLVKNVLQAMFSFDVQLVGNEIMKAGLRLEDTTHQFLYYVVFGSQKVSTLVTMACYLLARHEKVQNDLRKEIYEVIIRDKKGRAEVDMPLRRFGRQYEQLSWFERGRIIGLMEAGWSARRVARQLGRSGCSVRC